jgi:hypothetical protein
MSEQAAFKITPHCNFILIRGFRCIVIDTSGTPARLKPTILSAN